MGRTVCGRAMVGDAPSERGVAAGAGCDAVRRCPAAAGRPHHGTGRLGGRLRPHRIGGVRALVLAVLPLSDADRMDLLRRLLPADGPPAIAVGSRTAGAVGRREEAGSVGPAGGDAGAAGRGRVTVGPRRAGRRAGTKSPVGGAVECPDGVERTARVEPAAPRAVPWRSCTPRHGQRRGGAPGRRREWAPRRSGGRGRAPCRSDGRGRGAACRGSGPDGRRAGGGRPGTGVREGKQGRSSVELGEAEGVPGRAHRVHPPRTSPEAATGGPHAHPTWRDREGRGDGRRLGLLRHRWRSGEPSEPVRGRPARPFARPPRVHVHTADSLHARPSRPGSGRASGRANRRPTPRPGRWRASVRGGSWAAREGAAGRRAGCGRTAVGRGEAAWGLEGTRESSPTSVCAGGS